MPKKKPLKPVLIKVAPLTRTKMKLSKRGAETYDKLINRRMFPKKKKRQ